MKFLVTYEILGTHTHMRIWVHPPGQTPALSGTLILKNEEFTVFSAMLKRGGIKLEAEL